MDPRLKVVIAFTVFIGATFLFCMYFKFPTCGYYSHDEEEDKKDE